MKTDWTHTAFTKTIGVRYPIVQGPFGGGLSSVELAATVSELGGLGSFGAQPNEPAEIKDTVNAIRARTDRPFAINLWVSHELDAADRFSPEDFERLKELFKPYFEEAKVELPTTLTDLTPRYEEQLEAILEAKPPVFSFVFGVPSKEVLIECRRLGIKTMGTATTVDEALALEAAGVDAVVATGFEAGGHRVSFLRPAEDSLTGLAALLPAVTAKVRIPVVAAGGIANAAGVRAAFALGAHAAQIGTAFLATKESNATPEHKALLFTKAAENTLLTRAFTGRLGRGTAGKIAEDLRGKERLLAPYPLQSSFMAPLRKGLLAQGKAHYLTFWAGQAAGLLKHHHAAALFEELVRDLSAGDGR